MNTKGEVKGKGINQGQYDDDRSEDKFIDNKSDSDLDEMFDTPMVYSNCVSNMLGSGVTINSCAENTAISSISDHGCLGGEVECPINVDTDEGNNYLRSDNDK